MKKILLLLFFMLFTLLFNVSCNSIKFAYNQADWLVLNQINDIACLNSEQSDKVEKKIDSFLAWHRKNELPIYTRNLRKLGNALNAGPLDKNTYDQTQSFFETTQDRTIGQIRDFLVDFLAELPPQQIKCSIKNIEEKNRDKKEPDMDRDKYYRKVKEEMANHAETWLGYVTDEQIAMIDTVIPPQEEEKAYRKITERRSEYFKKLLLNPDKELKRKKLLEFINDPDSFYTEEELKFVKKRRERSKEGLWKLAQTLTEKQRKTLAKTLLEYAEDFEELSKE